MKKFIVCGVLMCSAIMPASAIITEIPDIVNNCCMDAPVGCTLFDESCIADSLTSACNCSDMTSTYNGVVTTMKRTFSISCSNGTAKATCTTTDTTYTCAANYYGTATSNSAGCTACPANATCAGGNGSTFICKKGYYKNGSACTACGGDATTKSTGSTTQLDCYIPSGTSFTDSIGSGSYTGDCYY